MDIRRLTDHAGAEAVGIDLTQAVSAEIKAALNQAFVTVSDGTVADGARLDVVIEPARVGCRSCGRTTTSDRMPARCPGCGGTGIDLQSGDGLVLELVEFDDAERRAGREPTA